MAHGDMVVVFTLILEAMCRTIGIEIDDYKRARREAEDLEFDPAPLLRAVNDDIETTDTLSNMVSAALTNEAHALAVAIRAIIPEASQGFQTWADQFLSKMTDRWHLLRNERYLLRKLAKKHEYLARVEAAARAYWAGYGDQTYADIAGARRLSPAALRRAVSKGRGTSTPVREYTGGAYQEVTRMTLAEIDKHSWSNRDVSDETLLQCNSGGEDDGFDRNYGTW